MSVGGFHNSGSGLGVEILVLSVHNVYNVQNVHNVYNGHCTLATALHWEELTLFFTMSSLCSVLCVVHILQSFLCEYTNTHGGGMN